MNGDKGMAFIGVIVAVLIFSSLSSVILFMGEQESLMARNEEETLKVLYAAEGGVRAVLALMQENPDITFQEIVDFCQYFTTLKVEVGDAVIESILPENLGDGVKITVTAISGRAKKILVALISYPLDAPDGTNAELVLWRERYDIY